MVQNLFFSPYTLQAKEQGKARYGALLKAVFADGKTGHADLHPYPEKREQNLQFYLNTLSQKNFEPMLCKRALAIAKMEALAWAQGVNLLSTLNIPSSHYLITDLENFRTLDKVLHQGFRVFKVKLRSPLKAQTQKLINLIKEGGPDMKWRIDFQQSLNKKQWQEWTTTKPLPLYRENIDFIEAPFDYQERGYDILYKGYPLAWDVWSGKTTLPVFALVYKSSRKNPEDLFNKQAWFQRVIFTHTLAHPLDQVVSAYFAGWFYHIKPRLREVCGLVQKDIYEKSAWTLPDKGPLFPKLSGPGWGFSHLLNRLTWKKLF